MTGPAYRNTARWYFEPAPRVDMAHRLPMAHRSETPEPLWAAVVVLLAALAGIWFVVTVVLAAVPG